MSLELRFYMHYKTPITLYAAMLNGSWLLKEQLIVQGLKFCVKWQTLWFQVHRMFYKTQNYWFLRLVSIS